MKVAGQSFPSQSDLPTDRVWSLCQKSLCLLPITLVDMFSTFCASFPHIPHIHNKNWLVPILAETHFSSSCDFFDQSLWQLDLDISFFIHGTPLAALVNNLAPSTWLLSMLFRNLEITILIISTIWMYGAIKFEVNLVYEWWELAKDLY